jgi:hypothetical protein
MDRTEAGVDVIGQLAQRYLTQLDGQGELPHPLRLRLHHELEDATGQELFGAFVDASAACAVRVWPIWRERYGDDPPYGAPEPGATVADPKLRFAPNKTELRRMRSFLDRRLWSFPEGAAAVTAALCCWRTNAVVLAGEVPREANGTEDSIDPAWYASVALAGQIFEDRNDPDARREFWTWYLTEAVPRSYGRVINAQEPVTSREPAGTIGPTGAAVPLMGGRHAGPAR